MVSFCWRQRATAEHAAATSSEQGSSFESVFIVRLLRLAAVARAVARSLRSILRMAVRTRGRPGCTAVSERPFSTASPLTQTHAAPARPVVRVPSGSCRPWSAAGASARRRSPNCRSRRPTTSPGTLDAALAQRVDDAARDLVVAAEDAVRPLAPRPRAARHRLVAPVLRTRSRAGRRLGDRQPGFGERLAHRRCARSCTTWKLAGPGDVDDAPAALRDRDARPPAARPAGRPARA